MSAADAKADKFTKEQRELHRLVGKSIWKARNAKTLPKGDGAAHKEAWKKDKKEMVAEGRKVVIRLERAGFSMTPPPAGSKKA